MADYERTHRHLTPGALCQEIMTHILPHRTLESIKSHRKQTAYKRKLQELGSIPEARSPTPPRARPVPRRRPRLREREETQLPADDLNPEVEEEAVTTPNSRNERRRSTEAEAERATLEALEAKVRECSSKLNIPALQTVAQIQAQLDA